MAERKPWDVVVVGGACLDCRLRGKEFPPARQARRADDFHLGAGGKGVLQAAAAARLGARVAFVGKVGTDEAGDRILAFLQDVGVNTDRVQRDERLPTGQGATFLGPGDSWHTLWYPGANDLLMPGDIEEVAECLASAEVVLTQLEIPLPTVAAVLRTARGAGVATILDAEPNAPLDDSLLRLVDVLRVDGEEGLEITGVRAVDFGSAGEAAHGLLSRGVRVAVVRVGTTGHFIAWGKKGAWHGSTAEKAVDVGMAGDAFCAALAVALAERRDPFEVGAFATAAMSLSMERLAARDFLPSREQVERHLPEQIREGSQKGFQAAG